MYAIANVFFFSGILFSTLFTYVCIHLFIRIYMYVCRVLINNVILNFFLVTLVVTSSLRGREFLFVGYKVGRF